jgi:hypothetical protein
MEPTILACALGAIAIDSISRLVEKKLWFGLFGAAALACAVLIWSNERFQHFRRGGDVFLDIPVDAYWRKGSGALRGYSLPLNEIELARRVLAEEPTMVLLANRMVQVSDVYHLSMMTTAGRWSPEGLKSLVSNRYFDLIVMAGDAHNPRFWADQPIWPEVVRRAVLEEYVLKKRDGPFWLYTPRVSVEGIRLDVFEE